MKKQIVVVMRGPSAAIFRQSENLTAKDFPSAIGPVNMTYETRWLNRGKDIAVPGHIWIEISGEADGLEEALVPFANAGLALIPIIAFSTNAAIGEPTIEVGFDNTPGVTERDYFQCYVPAETDVIHVSRHVNVPATVDLINALQKHSDSERLRRGINQYQLALNYWRLGLESLALAHLWMAVEAITKARLRMEINKCGLETDLELADSLGIPKQQLDGTVRKDLILNGDEECYKKAKDASDGFEHGFKNYQEISGLSRDVRHRMAKNVRTAILDMCDLDKNNYKILINEAFDKPLGHWPIVKYFRGKLIGSGNELAKKDNAYPFLRWKPQIKSARMTPDGKFDIQFTDTLTPELADGIKFQPGTFEAWQAE